ATFLHGWALYYRAWLGQSRLGLDEAIAAFATILGSEASMPSANDISVDLRDVEVIARSILGVALCHSLNQRQRTALEWIRLLDHPQAFPALREQAPAWTLVIDLEQQDYTAARAEIDRLVARSVDVPAVWLRLVAVQSLEEQLDPDARKLARWAVTELASRGELQQVLDLAERYGVSALGDRGFALRYVSGILVYQAVRAAHDSTEPATNPDHLARYADAAKDFALALSELDAAQYPDAVAACRKLAAWCLFFQGNFIDARLAFLEAEKSLKGDDAAEALWMAIACADRLVKAGAGERLAAELDTLVERFLRDYPSDERAPTLVLMRAYKADDASPELVDELLAVPESSDMRAPAVRRAAAMLYALHHDATTIDAAAEYGQRYLDLAVPLVMSDQHEVSGAGDGATRFAVDCRRCLDVALSESIANPRLARLVFAAFDAVGERVPEIVAEHRDEIDYRRIVAAAYEDDLSVADAFADAIWTRDPTTVWARSGARTLFEIGRRRLEDDRVEDDRMALDLVVRHGLRILEEYAGTPGARDDSRLMYIHTVVAQGLTRLWSRSPNDTALARQALAMHEETLAQRPRDGEALRSVGLLSEALGEPARAMECWRLIVAATSVRTEPWYEAKYHLVSVLATVEPERARAVMDQYRQLNPDLGPPPWNERFAALDARIPAAPGKENP
ncbi:MAG: hypothetical protein KDA25_12975, partial [Phycisphaerales bacterium]|nr:hypothetical protein [Phycisphaerales bacterium]